MEKEVSDGRTVTHITTLTDEARVDELAQMLGAGGEAAHRSAEEILHQVRARKEQP